MIEIFEAGLFSTIQDLGREGYQQYGVTRGGAMDVLALGAANALLGNDPNDACVEIASSGFSIGTHEKCVVAVAGAGFSLRVGERRVPTNSTLFLRAGDILTFDAAVRGRYAYLAVPGGFDVPRILGSRATALRDGFGGFEGRALRSGDVLESLDKTFRIERAGKTCSNEFIRYYTHPAPFRVVFGPHDEFFDDAARAKFLETEFVVSDVSDRMGMRLIGDKIERASGEVLSCGITRGAIQVPPDGQPIVLQADHQTTGGYPILGAVIRADIPRLAQKRAGERVSFQETTLAQARLALVELRTALRAAKT